MDKSEITFRVEATVAERVARDAESDTQARLKVDEA
jgi:hypothetical protein